MITRVLPLSACVIIALFTLILCWMFFVRYMCLLCVVLSLLRECCNCLSFLAASMRYASWLLVSTSLIACSVSTTRLVQLVLLVCCML